MSFAYRNTPKEVDFCGNGLPIKVEAAIYVAQPKVVGSVVISRVTPLNEGQYIALYNYDTDSLIRIYARDSPDPTKNEVLSEPPPPYNDNATELFADDLRALPFVSKFYTIAHDSTTLTITTREAAAFVHSIHFVSPSSYAIDSFQEGNEAVFRDNYRINCFIAVIKAGIEKKIIDFYLHPDSDQFAYFTIGSLIRPYLDVFLPALTSQTVEAFEIAQYKVLCSEEWEVDGVLNNTIYYEFSAYALNGKIEAERYPGFNLATEIISKKIFLNNNQDVELWRDAHFFLHFYTNYYAAENLNVRVKVYYTDLTSHSADLFTVGYVPGVMKIFTVPASIASLNLENYFPEKEIYKYEIWVDHATGDNLCKSKTFKVIDKPLFFKEFAYINKYGVADYFQAITKSTMKLEIEKSISRRNTSLDESTSYQQHFSKRLSSHNQFELSTGSISNEFAIQFQDAIESDGFFEIVEGEYIPCIVNDGSFDILPDSEDVVSIKFSYRRAFDK